MGRFGLFFLVVVLTQGCSLASQKQSWFENMHSMTESLEDLLPYIYSNQKYRDPENKKFIQTKLTRLNEASSSLSAHVAKGLSGNDPLLKVSLEGLQGNIERSLESFWVDNYAYSQQLLKSSVRYCVSCHTRTHVGRRFVVYENFGEQGNLANVDPLDLANAQIAMRQFDGARSTLLAFVQNNKQNLEERKRGLELLLVLHVRNQMTYELALKDLQSLKTQGAIAKEAPLQSWISDLKVLAQQKNWLSAEQMIEKLAQTPPAEPRLVRDLAWSRSLHELLMATEDGVKRAKMLFALGQIYQKHPSLSFWDLPESYFEACIVSAPHTKEAKKCYYSYEMSMRNNHQLKSSHSLPEKDRRHLIHLRVLSDPAPAHDDSGGGVRTERF